MLPLLVLIGLLTSPSAFAQAAPQGQQEPSLCERVLGAATDPLPSDIQVVKTTINKDEPAPPSPELVTVSVYVKKVLDRAREGMKMPQEDAGDNSNFTNIALLGQEEIIGTIDSAIDVLLQRKNLTEQTTCEQYDLLLIQCTMEKVRTQRNKELSELKYANALRLERLYSFLNERLRGLQKGVRDPTFKDTTWGEAQLFDAQGASVACCLSEDGSCQTRTADQCKEQGVAFYSMDACKEFGCSGSAATDSLCSFNTNFTPPTVTGYGCDADVLEQLKKYPPALEDAKKLRKIQESIKTFTNNAKSLLTVQQEIATLAGGATSSQSPTTSESERAHKMIDGCQQGQCSGNDNPCQSNADCDGEICSYSWRHCSEDMTVGCFLNSDCADKDLGDCVREAPDLLLVPERTDFSATRDELKILEAFASQREQERREFVDDLKLPDEFPSSAQDKADARAENGGIQDTLRAVRGLFISVSAGLGRMEADMFARGQDPELTMAQSLAPVRGVGSKLATLANDRTGLRQLVTRFAWFLRRTCIDRACNGRLQQIIAIAQADACFPYTKGDFLSQTCEKPQWQECLDEAKISDPKAPTDLNCP